MKKNILIISYSYPPSNAPAAQRPYSIAKYLDKTKYNVTVLTCGNADSSLGFDATFNPQLAGVTCIRIDAFFGGKISNFRKHRDVADKNSLISKAKRQLVVAGTSFLIPDKAMFWYPKVVQFLKENENLVNDTDIIFSTSPVFTNHLIARYIVKKKPEVFWVSDFRDFHYVENLQYVKGKQKSVNKRLEKSVIKHSKVVLFISNSMRDLYAKHYQAYVDKMKVLYNGFDVADFKGLETKTIKSKELSIFYAGSFYGGDRCPLPLFKLIDAALDRKIIAIDAIKIVIAGNLEDSLIERLKEYKSYSCLKYLGCIPRTEVLAMMTTSSLLWLIVSKKPTHFNVVPVKLYEYMAARRPVLNFSPNTSESTKMVLDNSLGWSIDEDEKTIEDQLLIFKQIVSAFNNGTLHKPLCNTILDTYNRERQTSIFETFIDV